MVLLLFLQTLGSGLKKRASACFRHFFPTVIRTRRPFMHTNCATLSLWCYFRHATHCNAFGAVWKQCLLGQFFHTARLCNEEKRREKKRKRKKKEKKKEKKEKKKKRKEEKKERKRGDSDTQCNRPSVPAVPYVLHVASMLASCYRTSSMHAS